MPGTWTEVWDRADGLLAPVAATLPDAAAWLGASLAAVELAARHVEPYRHADGSPRWSVGELAARLGLVERDRKGRRLSLRTGDRHGYGRQAARAGAAATRRHRWAARTAEDGPEVEDLAAVDPGELAAVEDLAELPEQ